MRITKRLRKGANALAALAAGLMLFGAAACSHDSGGSEDRKEDDKTGTSTSALYRLNATEGCDFADGAITNFGSGDNSTDASGGVFLYYPEAIDLAKDTAELTATVKVNATDGYVGLGVIDVYGGKVDSYVVATAKQKVRYHTGAVEDGSGWSGTILLTDSTCAVGTTYIWKVSVSGGKIKFEICDSTGATVLAAKDNSYDKWVAANGKNYLAIGAAVGSTANLTWSNIKVKVNGGTEYTIDKIEDVPDKSTLAVAKTSVEVNLNSTTDVAYTALDKNGEKTTVTVDPKDDSIATATVEEDKIVVSGGRSGSTTLTITNTASPELKATLAVTVLSFNSEDPAYTGILLYPADGAEKVFEDGEFMIGGFEAKPTLNDGGSIKLYEVTADGVTLADSIAFANETQTIWSGETRNVAGQLVRVTDSAIYFTPHIGKVENGKQYLVAISQDAITGKIGGTDFTGLTNNKESTKWKFTTRDKPSVSTDITVNGAQDSTANFRTIQGALNAIGEKTGSYKITVADGTYRELLYFKGKASVEIEGNKADRSKVVVEYANGNALNSGNKPRCLFEFEEGGDLVLDSLTFINTYSRADYSGEAQAETLGHDADGTVAAYNCVFKSHQDTIRTISKAWFYNCYIEGDTDFLWQEGAGKVALYEKCEIKSVYDENARNHTSYVVAPKMNIADSVSKGLVIFNSKVTSDDRQTTYLARTPWTSGCYNQAAYIKTEVTGAQKEWTGLKDYPCLTKSGTKQNIIGWKMDVETAKSIGRNTTGDDIVSDEDVAAEYSGRRAILNRVYKDGKFVQDVSGKWDVDALITSQGWKVDEDTSSDLASGETEKKSKKYDMMVLAAPDSATLAEGSADGISWKGLKDNGNKDWKYAKEDATVTFSVTEKSVVELEAYNNGVGNLSATVGGTKVVDSASACSKTAFLTSGAGEVIITFTGETYFKTITVFTRTDEVNKAGAVAVTLTDTQIAKDETTTATATVTPYYLNNTGSDAISTDVTWSSSSLSVATVTSSGAVSGVAAGTADIIAASKATPSVSGKATLTVTATATTVVPLVTWDFSTNSVTVLNSDKITEANQQTLQSGATGYLQGDSTNVLIEVAATGKIYARGGDAQINEGTKLHIPVSSGSVVTVKNYSSGNDCTYTLGGVTGINNTSKGQEVSWKASSSGYVELEVTTSNYLLSISVTNVDHSADHTSVATGALLQ